MGLLSVGASVGHRTRLSLCPDLVRVAATRAAVLTALLVSPPLAAQTADLTSVGHARGSVDAPVVVIEYADFACSACAVFAETTWPTIERDYIATGIVRWHLIPFELGFRNSREGARAGECAADLGGFWPMHDLLFDRRSDWEGERRPENALVALAVEAGLDEDAFRRCYDGKDDSDGRDRIEAANRAAKGDGVRATPTFFINGFQVQGALPPETFAELIEAARARTPNGAR